MAVAMAVAIGAVVAIGLGRQTGAIGICRRRRVGVLRVGVVNCMLDLGPHVIHAIRLDRCPAELERQKHQQEDGEEATHGAHRSSTRTNP